MSSFFNAFSIRLLDAGRAEQNLEKLATCTIFSQKACAKLLLDFSRICGIIILVKRRCRWNWYYPPRGIKIFEKIQKTS